MTKMKRMVETSTTNSTLIGQVDTGTANITTTFYYPIDNIMAQTETNKTIEKIQAHTMKHKSHIMVSDFTVSKNKNWKMKEAHYRIKRAHTPMI